MKFYDREDEMKELETLSKAAEKKTVMCVVTGVRRVGKTELIKQFFKKEKGLYFFVDGSKTSVQLLAEFTAELKAALGLPERLAVSSWDEFFQDLFAEAKKRKLVVAFDEFQRFTKTDANLPFILQKHFDLNKNESKLFLIISGSSFGLLKGMFIEQDAPLFQRPANILRLRQFGFGTVCEVLDDLGVKKFEDKVEFYALFGGIPKYYDLLEDYGAKTVDDAVKTLVFGGQAPLKDEVKNVMMEEFGKENPTYYGILSAVAWGKTKPNEIAGYAEVKETSLGPYLYDLADVLGALGKALPVTESLKSKKGRYWLDNNFFKFWFKFVHRKKSEFELGRFEQLFKDFQAEKNAFVGRAFEEVCKQYLVKTVEFDRVGGWWGKGRNETVEIDLVALNEAKSSALFAECKWQEKQPSIADLEDLRQKSAFVDWRYGKRSDRFAFFSKSGFDRKTAGYGREKGWLLVGLRELEKAFARP